MSAKDVFHQVVKTALQKDGWQITNDPLTISGGGVNLSIDLAAEKLIAAEREGQKIAVEVKSFLERSSAISEFHTALGQFINLGVSNQTIQEIINGQRSITVDIAIRLGKALENGPRLWLNLQQKVDLWDALQSHKEEYEQFLV